MYCIHGVFGAGECPRCFPARQTPPRNGPVLVVLGLICVLVTGVAMARDPEWVTVLQGLGLFGVVAGTFRGVAGFFAWTRSR